MRWPGIPPNLWKQLDEIVDKTEQALNASSDGSVLSLSGDGGMCIGIPPGDSIRAIITGGNNPYSWRSAQPSANGFDGTVANTGGELTGDEPSGPCAGTGTSRFRAAWERNGNTRVLPGTVVTLYPRYLDIGGEDQEYEFDFTEEPIVAELFSDQVPSTPLSASVPAGATTLKPVDYTQFPAENGFGVKVDNEYYFVSSGAGTSTWTVAPGYKGSAQEPHATNANITLAGTRWWMQQEPAAFGRWQSQPNGFVGHHLLEPAYELHGAFELPKTFYAELMRRSIDGVGTAVLGADLGSSTPTLTTSGPTTLPAYAPYSARIDDEYVYVLSVSGPTLGIKRGTFDTQGTSHQQGAGIRACHSEWYYEMSSGTDATGGGSGPSAPSAPSQPSGLTSGLGLWDENCNIVTVNFVNGILQAVM